MVYRTTAEFQDLALEKQPCRLRNESGVRWGTLFRVTVFRVLGGANFRNSTRWKRLGGPILENIVFLKLLFYDGGLNHGG
jgi:hypothetical protein